MNCGARNMNYEVWRLASFSGLPPSFVFSASKLANAGFYYTGKEDEVVCFSCNIRIKDWASKSLPVNPLLIHFDDSSHCRFLESGNVPYNTSNTFISWEKKKKITCGLFSEISDTKLDKNVETNRLQCYNDAPSTVIRQTNDGTMEQHIDYTIEAHRLRSFDGAQSAIIRPIEMARAGLFFLGNEARFQCAFCKGVLHIWNASDDAFTEHTKYFPLCPFVQDQHKILNVPLSDDVKEGHLSENISARQQKKATSMLGHRSRATSDPRRLPNGQRYPTSNKKRLEQKQDYRVEANRLQSFDGTPLTDTHTSEIAKAGFFYTGPHDWVQCVFCKGVLRGQKACPDALRKHKKYFRNCRFIKNPLGVGNVPLQTDKNVSNEHQTSKPSRPLQLRCDFDPKKLGLTLYNNYVNDEPNNGNLTEVTLTCIDHRPDELELCSVEKTLELDGEDEDATTASSTVAEQPQCTGGHSFMVSRHENRNWARSAKNVLGNIFFKALTWRWKKTR